MKSMAKTLRKVRCREEDDEAGIAEETDKKIGTKKKQRAQR